MALQSQAPRAGTGRRYTSGGKRKTGLAPWLALVGIGVIVAGLYVIYFGDPPANPAQADQANAADTNAAQTDTTARQASATSTGSGTNTPANQLSRSSGPTADNATARNTEPTGTTDTGAAGVTSTLTGESKDQYELGMQRLESGDLVAGRALLSEVLFRDGALPRHEAQAVRERLGHLAQQHVFTKSTRSSEKIAADPILALHTVKSGEYLSTIANTYDTPYQFIERVNNIDARKLQAGQTLQVLKGPVHAIVDKSDYRMDLFVYDANGLRIYLKSYTVGLGEFDSTPMGMWRIKPGSKVGPANGGPSWRNPRTGEVYDRNDPDIPIGEYWMALEGIDENTKGKNGYGIHATNDPASIGRQESMGCIRMRDADVDEVFYTLFETLSTVQIVP